MENIPKNNLNNIIKYCSHECKKCPLHHKIRKYCDLIDIWVRINKANDKIKN